MILKPSDGKMEQAVSSLSHNKSMQFLKITEAFKPFYLRNRSRERCHFQLTILPCLFFQKI